MSTDEIPKEALPELIEDQEAFFADHTVKQFFAVKEKEYLWKGKANIKAEILADSINSGGQRIVTWKLTYPRFIHSEFMTHRVFSRNAASSRAIPVEKMIKAVRETPALPVFWGANQKGMQAKVELDEEAIIKAYDRWITAAHIATYQAEELVKIGLHKQIANRVLEPFMHMTTLATATDLGNFFALRAHEEAQPEFQVLAYKMLDTYQQHEPTELADGEWHIPFGDAMPDSWLNDWFNDGSGVVHMSPEEFAEAKQQLKLKIATARCARTSYLNFDGSNDVFKDVELHNRLADSGHWSPFEHCAKASPNSRSGNFTGWTQYRKQFTNENRKDPRITPFSTS